LTGDQLKNKIDKNLGIIEASKTNNCTITKVIELNVITRFLPKSE